jgi:hypothetical protein
VILGPEPQTGKFLVRANACGQNRITNKNAQARLAVHLIEILLPLFDNDGAPIASREFTRVSDELTREFGGLTAFTREPAEGRWRKDAQTQRDQIVIFEVMTEDVDHNWWSTYRETLQKRYRQETILVRSHEVTRL